MTTLAWCPECGHLHLDEDDSATPCTAVDGCACEGVCNDCGRPVTYDDEADDWRHKVDPARGCFLISAEVSG